MLTVSAILACLLRAAPATTQRWKADIPKTWDEVALADWATPVAGLNLRPSHMSASEYYSWPTENVRTYPVYYPGLEPKGYWEMLESIGPKPLVEADTLNTEDDWTAAGRRVFDELDHFHLRTYDPKFIAAARSLETFQQPGVKPLPDGTVFGMRWVPTMQGVALSFSNCSNCHLLYLKDGTRIPGAPALAAVSRVEPRALTVPLLRAVSDANHVIGTAIPFRMPEEALGLLWYRAYGVPWLKEDPNERLKTMKAADGTAFAGAGMQGGAFPRWNGSVFYPTKIPDLIGFKDRKYIDATATHLHRNVGDFMRYAALVSFAETTDFGPHHVIGEGPKRPAMRAPDEALYALALYIYSLKPPPNPNTFDAKAMAGERIFAREGCPRCHTPPLYTSNKLTLAQGFEPPKDAPAMLDILPISVKTDPGLALRTRKGTGYYKVPSLKGVWYRGHYLHDGAAASLDEMFDPDRLKDTHARGGFTAPGTTSGAIQGHEFGLHLDPLEREQLLAFLRTL
jgi:mono/diheme cytochrome c family protein